MGQVSVHSTEKDCRNNYSANSASDAVFAYVRSFLAPRRISRAQEEEEVWTPVKPNSRQKLVVGSSRSPLGSQQPSARKEREENVHDCFWHAKERKKMVLYRFHSSPLPSYVKRDVFFSSSSRLFHLRNSVELHLSSEDNNGEEVIRQSEIELKSRGYQPSDIVYFRLLNR